MLNLLEVAQIAGDENKVPYVELSQKLGLSEKELIAIVERLKSQKLLEFRDGEKLHIFFDKVVHSITSKNFVLNAAREGMRRIESQFEDRDNMFLTHTLTMIPSDYANFVSEYKSLLDKYMSHEGRVAEAKRVYVANIQCFKAL